MLTIRKNTLPTLLDELFNDDLFFIPSIHNNTFTPLSDVIENDDKFEVELMLPAFNKEDFKLEVKDDTLTIEGERKVDEDVKYSAKQSYFGSFKKSYTLPDSVDKDNINASYENGVLKVIVPKVEDKVVKPKLIEVV